MWGEVLGLALVVSLNPVLLAFILLVISRPRPLPNLVGFWIGSVVVNLPTMLLPMMALHLIPAFASFARDVTTANEGSTVRPLQALCGVLAILVAVALGVRFWMRRRTKQLAVVGAGGGGRSVMVDDFDGPAGEAPQPERSVGAFGRIRFGASRLLRRGKKAWDSGSLWVSVVFGLGYIAPIPLVLLVDTIIAGSGAPIGVQVAAGVVFVVAMLALFEIILLSYVVAPTRTRALLEPLHNWARAHRQEVLIALFAVVGVWQMVTGMGVV
ncbi:GAP family protein [Mycolicibacterium moriokaense]|nr:GAP family protein [Mycolicibacterium moriokaense]